MKTEGNGLVSLIYQKLIDLILKKFKKEFYNKNYSLHPTKCVILAEIVSEENDSAALINHCSCPSSFGLLLSMQNNTVQTVG
jgi:hypothetical protein